MFSLKGLALKTGSGSGGSPPPPPPPPAPSFVSTSTSNVPTASNTVTAPASIQDGDMILAVAEHTTGSLTMSTLPSGFSEVTFTAAGSNSYGVYRKTAAAESGNYTFEWSSAGNNTISLLVYRGVSTLLAGTAFKETAALPTVAPSISPASSGILLEIFFSEPTTNTYIIAPGGTERVYLSTGNAPSLFIGDYNPQASGATGGKEMYWNNGDNFTSQLIQLMP